MSTANVRAEAAPHGFDQPIIWAEGLGKRFGSLEALRDVSLTVAKGEVVCVEWFRQEHVAALLCPARGADVRPHPHGRQGDRLRACRSCGRATNPPQPARD